MNKRSIFILIGFLALGTLLRLWNLDKPEGMWNDEYLTWQIASAAFPIDFLKAIQTNCHAPLHYFYLKGWMAVFKDTDYILRLSSVVPCVLAIAVMYFTGLEFANNKKLEKTKELVALTSAGLCTISSFLIYFSQEVRIYTLTFLLTSLVVWFSLRLYNSQTKSNYVLLGLFSLLLMLEHTIGFVFVFFNTIAILVFKLLKGKKKEVMPYIWTFLGVVVLVLPLVPFIFKILARPTYFSQWWAPFSWSKVYFFFTDLFSPVIVNITDSPDFISALFQDGTFNITFAVYALIPTLICLICIFRNFIKPKKIQLYVFTVFLTTFLVVLMASIAGKLIFLTKYSIELYPLLILLVASGLGSFKSKGLRIVLPTIFAVISLFFIAVSYTSAPKIMRNEGHRLPLVAMEQYGLKKNDKILLTYYPKERFLKYGELKNAASIDKYNFAQVLKGDGATTFDAFKNGKKEYKEMFSSRKNPRLDTYLNENIFSHMKKGEKLFVVTLETVSIYNKDVFVKILKNENIYEKIPFLYLLTSYATNYSLSMAQEKLHYKTSLEKGKWKIYVFEAV